MRQRVRVHREIQRSQAYVRNHVIIVTRVLKPDIVVVSFLPFPDHQFF